MPDLKWPTRIGLIALTCVTYVGLFFLITPVLGLTVGLLSLFVLSLTVFLAGRHPWTIVVALAVSTLNLQLYLSVGFETHWHEHLIGSVFGVVLGMMGLRANTWLRALKQQQLDLQAERARLEAEMSRREFVEASLQAERDFARLIIDSLGQGLVLMNSRLRFEYVNPAYAAMVGRRPEEIIGKTPFDLSDASDHARIQASLDRRQRGEPHTYDLRLKHADGRSIDVLVTVTPRYSEGTVNGSIVVVTDVSDHKRIEAELRHSREQAERQSRILEQTQSTARVGGWELDLRTGAMYWTREMHRLLEVDPDTFEVTVEKATAIYAPEHQDRVSAVVQRAVALGEPYVLDVEIITYGGRRLWVRTAAQPVFKDGNPIKLYGSFQDISEQKRAEEQLRRAEAEYRSLYENVPIGIYRSTRDGSQAHVNPYLVRLNGFQTEAEQIAAIKDIGQDWYVDPTRRAAFVEAIERDGEVINFESEIRRPTTGERLWITENARAIRDADGNATQYEGSVLDITDRKRIELALESERQFATSVMNAMGQGLTVTGLDGRFIYVNAACAHLLGCKPEEIIGLTPMDFIVESDHPIFQTALKARATGERTSYETTLRRRDGGTVVVLITGVARFDQGKMVGSIATLTDLTALRQREQELREVNQELASKNREMETFTYSVSHDLKAPLRGIDGYSRILLEDYSDKLDDEGRRFLRTIRSATEQMNQLITDLLAYSRLERRALSDAPINLSELVGAVIAQRLRDANGREPTLLLDLPPLTIVRGDRDGLAQAVRNLVDNAFKFTRDAEQPQIEVRAERIQAEQDDSVVRLSVRDNGVGFDMQYHDKIFGIFTRLHRAEDYPGTGVGLALVRKAMERMGGRVWAESQPGAGATFYLELPAADEAAFSVEART